VDDTSTQVLDSAEATRSAPLEEFPGDDAPTKTDDELSSGEPETRTQAGEPPRETDTGPGEDPTATEID